MPIFRKTSHPARGESSVTATLYFAHEKIESFNHSPPRISPGSYRSRKNALTLVLATQYSSQCPSINDIIVSVMFELSLSEKCLFRAKI
jgi:hypothetical protein